MNTKKKNARGITLIALVITIIVLLILAGVTINALSGENGILKRATQAKSKTGRSNALEQINLAIITARTEGLGQVDKKVLTTCPHCATGCQYYLVVRDNKVVMGNPAREIAENSGSVFK